MNKLEVLQKRRDEIIKKISSIKKLRRGTINEQYLKVPQKDSEPALRGPYYVLSKSVKGKTKSQRIKSEDIENTKSEINAYSEFISLTNEFAEITEEITQILNSEEVEEEEENSLKKN